MTPPLCPLCHRPTAQYLWTVDRNRRVSRAVFVYYRCAICGLILLAPVPPDLARYYQSDYYPIPHSLDELARMSANERYKLDILSRFATEGNLLEIGPSYGAFAYLAKQAGFTVETIERDSECCRFLEDVVGVRALQSDNVIAALQHTETKAFDVVALWHVIEHLPDPWRMLEALAARVKENGLLVIATPNPQAIQFRMLGRFWAHIDAPRHLALIPAPLLTQQMQALGLQLAFITTADEGTVRNNKFGWHGSLMAIASSPAPRRVLRTVGRIIGKIMGPFEQHRMRGSGYTAVFRKYIPRQAAQKLP